MAAKYLIDLILRLSKQGTGGKETEKELEGVGKAAKGLQDQWKQFAGAGVAVAGAFATVKKAIDWGREGAAVIQTSESFDLLIEKVGASSDTLDQLRQASRGTVDDMTLMSATTTLLAGAQGELATGLADATPKLMEIAKAANKLNPSLGDTTFLYNSLATGIKRSSPLILDNLGLTLKIGEANTKYAASIGKTVEQLTAEEQKMALLQATLEAGNVLIQQAGGTTEAMGDSFAAAEAQIKNATDQLKAGFAPAVAQVMTAVADASSKLLDFLDWKDVQTYADQVAATSTQYRQYAKAVLDAAVADKQLTQAEADAVQAHMVHGESLESVEKRTGYNIEAGMRYVQALGLMTRSEWDAIKSTEGLSFAHEEMRLAFEQTVDTEQLAAMEAAKLAASQDVARKSFEVFTDEIKTMATELGMAEKDVFKYKVELGYTDQELKRVADDLNITGGEFDALAQKTGLSRQELERLNSEFGMGEDEILQYAQAIENVKAAYESFVGTLASGIIGLRDLGAEQAKSAADYESQLAALEQKQRGVTQGMALNFKAALPDPTDVKTRLGMAGDAWDEWGLRLQDIIQNGIASPWYATLQQMGMEKPPDVGVKEWAQDLKAAFYAGEIPDLLPPEWIANIKAQQAEATATFNQEAANRRAAVQTEIDALKAAREEQLAIEREARNQATIELAMSLAEQSGQLQAWSEQKFGPDFSQVADSASEVMALLDSGMLTVDASLQSLLENMVGGIGQALDMTGQAVEENKAKLQSIAEYDPFAPMAEKAEALDEMLKLDPTAAEEFKAQMAQMGDAVQSALSPEEMPEDPFAAMTSGFEGFTNAILGGAGEMKDGMVGAFQGILDEGSTPVAQAILNEWINQSVLPDLEAAGSSMQSRLSASFQAVGNAAQAAGAVATGAIQQINNTVNSLVTTLGAAQKGFQKTATAANKLLEKVKALNAALQTMVNLLQQMPTTEQSPPPAATGMEMTAAAAANLAQVMASNLRGAIKSTSQAWGQFAPATVGVGAGIGMDVVRLPARTTTTTTTSNETRTVYVSGDKHTWNIQDQGSVALAMRMVENKRRERLNEFMGV